MHYSDMLFDGFPGLARTLIVGSLAYISIMLFLRVSGSRTLSKMNAFDFIVTIALGSTLAAVLLNRSIPLADGIMAFGLLIGLQYVVTWTSVRFQWVRKIVTGEPRILFCRGEFLPMALREARVTENEIRAALRSAGIARVEDGEAVILETDGSFSVIRRTSKTGSSSLDGVKGPRPRDTQRNP